MKKTARILSLAIFMLMIITLIKPVSVGAVNPEDPTFDKSGIVQINIQHTDVNNGSKMYIQSGSGVLICDRRDYSRQYVLTSNSVIEVPEGSRSYLAEMCGLTDPNFVPYIVVDGGTEQSATVIYTDPSKDIAILSLDATIGKNALIIKTDGPAPEETVYSAGYTDDLRDGALHMFGIENVVINPGAVAANRINVNGIDYCQHFGVVSPGTVGGPVLDSEGYVVAVNTTQNPSEGDTSYYSVSITEYTAAMDGMDIHYQLKGFEYEEVVTEAPTEEETEAPTEEAAEEEEENEEEATDSDATGTDANHTMKDLEKLIEEAEALNKDDYTKSSYEDLEEALAAAKELTESDKKIGPKKLNNTYNDLQKAMDNLKKVKSNLVLLIIIIVAVVIIIVVVVIVVVSSNNKKKKRKPVNSRPPVNSMYANANSQSQMLRMNIQTGAPVPSNMGIPKPQAPSNMGIPKPQAPSNMGAPGFNIPRPQAPNPMGAQPSNVQPPRPTGMGAPVPPQMAQSGMTGAPVPPQPVQQAMTGAPVPPQPVQQAMTGAPVPPQMAQSGMTGAPIPPAAAQTAMKMMDNSDDGSGETSVLGGNDGEAETSVLSNIRVAAKLPTAKLVRMRTGEIGVIDKELYRIGKERSKVDFCITNNNSISRIHADIIVKDGKFYIVDNKSTNYTFVNGQMAPAKLETPIVDGDKITLAEEEFKFMVDRD